MPNTCDMKTSNILNFKNKKERKRFIEAVERERGLYYNPDGELTKDGWDPKLDSQFSLIVFGAIVAVIATFEVIGIITVIKWIF